MGSRNISCHIYDFCLVWQFTSKENLNKLLITQKKLTRILTWSPYNTHSNPLYVSLKILKTPDAFNSELIKFFYKHYKSLLPKVVSCLFCKNSTIHNYPTRSSDLIHIPKTFDDQIWSKKSKSKWCLCLEQFFNSNLKNNDTIKSFNQFKKFLKNRFLDSY